MALAGGPRTNGGVVPSAGSWYASMARDATKTPAQREAAGLLAAAEAHHLEEEVGPARQLAEEARTKFRALGDEEAAADAFRLVVSGLLFEGKHKEAGQLVKDELARIRASADRVGEGKVLLASAEIHADRRQGHGSEDPLEQAQGAAALFREKGDKRMEATALLVLLNLHMKRLGDRKEAAAEAHRTAQEALGMFRELGDKRGEGTALHGVAASYLRCVALGATAIAPPEGGWLGAAREAAQIFHDAKLRKLEAFERICIAQGLTSENPRKGLRAAEEALAFCREVGSQQEPLALSAVVQAHLAIQDISKAWMRKEAGEAVQKAKLGLARFRNLGDAFGEGQALSSLVAAYLARGSVPEALAAAEGAVQVFQALGDRESESTMLQLTTGLHLQEDQPDKAMRAAKQINAISSSLAERAVALETIHEVHLQRGEWKKARSIAEELLELCEDDGDKKRGAIARLMISNAHYAEGNFPEAIAMAREAQAVLNDLGAVREEAQSLRVVAEVHLANKEPEAALRAAEKAKRLLRTVDDEEQGAATLFLIAQIRLQHMVAQREAFPDRPVPAGDAESAVSSAEEAVAAARRLGDERLSGSALCVLAQVLLVNMHVEAAQKAVDEAVTVFRELADERNQACALCIQADIHLFNGNSRRALQTVERALGTFQALGDSRGEWAALSIREYISGPPPAEELPPPPQELAQGEWSADEWRQWEDWQRQQQALAPAPAQAQNQQQVDKPRRRRAPVNLGDRLNLNALNADDVQRKLADIVKATIDLDEEEPFDLDQPLMQVGITSKTAVALRNVLSEEIPGLQLPFTLVFDYPSVNAMTEMIMDTVSAG